MSPRDANSSSRHARREAKNQPGCHKLKSCTIQGQGLTENRFYTNTINVIVQRHSVQRHSFTFRENGIRNQLFPPNRLPGELIPRTRLPGFDQLPAGRNLSNFAPNPNPDPKYPKLVTWHLTLTLNPVCGEAFHLVQKTGVLRRHGHTATCFYLGDLY